MKGILPISVNSLFWSIIGSLRYFCDKPKHNSTGLTDLQLADAVKDVAICVPAHNEELVIRNTIASLKKLVPANQIYVVSDGSIDKTANITRQLNCIVLELNPGRGKAKALEKLMDYFNLLKRYRYILIADADTIFDKNYLRHALPLFSKHKSVAVVAAYTKTRWQQHTKLNKEMLFVAYRMRLYEFIQPFIMYGQTWHRTNVNPVIPGFACLYRTDILSQLNFDVPGIIIEDFNMAFQLHKKHLGTIAHDPSVIATTQDPNNRNDYWHQLQRWNLGFFQTIKYWGIWPSIFWLALSVSIAEMIIFSLLLFLLPILLTFLVVYNYTQPLLSTDNPTINFLSSHIGDLFLFYSALFIVDYLITLFIAIKEKKDQLAIYGLFFIFIRYIDATIFLTTLLKAFFTTSSGVWTPPTRRTS